MDRAGALDVVVVAAKRYIARKGHNHDHDCDLCGALRAVDVAEETPATINRGEWEMTIRHSRSGLTGAHARPCIACYIQQLETKVAHLESALRTESKQ